MYRLGVVYYLSAPFLVLDHFGPCTYKRPLFPFEPSIRSTLAIWLAVLQLRAQGYQLHTRNSLRMRHIRSLAAQSEQSIKVLPYFSWHPHLLHYYEYCYKCHTNVTGVEELTRAFHAGRVSTELLAFRMCDSRQH